MQSINLAYGLTGGDRALVAVGARLRAFVATEIEDGFVARIGGAEFLVGSRRPVTRARWQWLAEALAARLARPIDIGPSLRFAPRIALLRGARAEGAAALLARLDETLVALMKTPGKRLQWADGGQRARGRSAARLEGDLVVALDRDEIAVLLQPQYAVADGRLVGAEALARWDHPLLGRIGAETLFAIAERGDHVLQLSRHIAAKALEIGGAVCAARGIRLSLNVTAADVAAPDFTETMRRMIAAAGIAPGDVALELTEQDLVADLSRAGAALAALAGDGMGVALDDFGTGFANFRMLRALPLDALKIDASLVRDVASDPRDRAIFAAICAMARALGLKVVAEGIESDAQLEVLREEGVAAFQGFLRSGPVSAAALAALAV